MEIDAGRLERATARLEEVCKQNELAGFVNLVTSRDYGETMLEALKTFPNLVETVASLKERLKEEQEKVHSLHKEIERLNKLIPVQTEGDSK